MRHYFIFQYEDLVSAKQRIRVTVLFVHQSKILSQNVLSQEISHFFQEHSITDKLVVIVPEYMEESSLDYFVSSKDVTFQRIPGKSPDYFDRCLIIYKFNKEGSLTLFKGNPPSNENKFIQHLFRSGSTIIFKNNGGLVESTADHHFVFPSNKHCAKFIRTGNVLINQAEIFFLSIQLLKHITQNIVYCDTSSINVLPYTTFELKRRFSSQIDCPIVHSFESYEVFESSKESFAPDSLVLISSSTSGNIIDRLLKERRAEKAQILVIYFLGPKENYQSHMTNILCNLTKDEHFPLGEDVFDAFTRVDDCKLCQNHSRPINIRSDIFLTIQPKIERHLLSVKSDYYSRSVESFVKNYRSRSASEGVIKAYFKDNDTDANYELYFDISYLLDKIENFPKFEKALKRHIDKYIPANTKYILYLPDLSSEQLAKYVAANIPDSIKPILIKLDKDFIDKITEDTGSVVVIASCITTGKKLLQISRLMRSKEDMNLVYFVGMHRPINEKFANDLISDLKKGKDKSDERPFVAVETIHCSIQQIATSWEREKVFLEELIGTIDEQKDAELYAYVNNRIDILRDNKRSRGLIDDVFLKKVDGEKLKLRKNFAFWTFIYHEEEVSQAEVYFTISTIISNLEQKNINSHPSLKQTNYVRNMLSPRNFHRFNDGIIQAAMLRGGKTDHFAYDLDSELSLQMKEFLLSIIEKSEDADGEALMEFLLAIGIKRLKLKKQDLIEILQNAQKCNHKIISKFATYILERNV